MKRFLAWALFLALVHYCFLLLWQGSIFVVAHIPPSAVRLDGIILGATWVERILIAPRLLMRSLWPVESSPSGLNALLAVLNSLCWGCLLAGIRRAIEKFKRRGVEKRL